MGGIGYHSMCLSWLGPLLPGGRGMDEMAFKEGRIGG